MMKKVKCLLLAVVMLILLSVEALAAYDIEYQMNEALGIFPYENYNSDEKYVTRGEFAYIAARMADLDVSLYSQKGEIYFTDITPDYEYAPYINALARFNMIKGYSDGTFEPEYKVSRFDMAYTLSNVLGYGDDYIQFVGGYPIGYEKTAADLGLFKGVEFGEYITQAEISKVLYNTLNQYLLLDDRFGNEKEITLMYNSFKVKKIQGVVTANDISDLNGNNGLQQGYIAIENNQYYAPDIDRNLLGHYVTAFVRVTDDEEIVIVAVSTKTNTVRINDKDIEPTSTMDTIISTVDNRERRYKIDVNNVEYMYNGQYSDSLSVSDIFTKSGYLELIDSNNDGIYEVVSITNYESLVVLSVSKNNKKISGKNGEKLELLEKKYKIYFDGKEISIEDLNKFDCISYTRTKNDDDYELFVTRGEEINGTITGKTNDNKVSIDGSTYYEISEAYLNNTGLTELNVHMSGDFYLDIMGRIIAYEKVISSDSNEKYGYLVKISRDLDENTASAKIYTVSGQMTQISISKSVRVDGVKYKENLTYVDNLITRDNYIKRPIKYTVNDNEEITRIDSDIMGSTEKSGVDLTEWVIPEISSGQYGGTWINSDYGIFEGRFFSGKSTVLIKVAPDGFEDDESLYSVTTIRALGNGSSPKGMRAFDVNDRFEPALIIVPGASSQSVQRQSPMVMIKEVFEEWDDEECVTVTGIIDAAGNKIKAQSADCLKINGNLPQKGDVIRYALDAKQRIAAVQMICDVSEFDNGIPTKVFGSAAESEAYWLFRADERIGVHILLEANDDRFMVADLPEYISGSNTYNFTYKGKTYPVAAMHADGRNNSIFVHSYSGDVCVYDSDTNKVYVSDVSVLSEAVYNPADSNSKKNRVVVYQGYGYTRKLFVIK